MQKPDGRERDDEAIAELFASVGIRRPRLDEQMPRLPADQEAIYAAGVRHRRSQQVWTAGYADVAACLVAAGIPECELEAIGFDEVCRLVDSILYSSEYALGFVTSRGRFVGARRAYRLARRAGQCGFTPDGLLDFDDLAWLAKAEVEGDDEAEA